MILGALILRSSVVDEVSQVLSEDDFSDAKKWLIYKTMLAISKEEGTIDPVALAEELKERGALEVVGGREYIYSLMDIPPDPHIAAVLGKVFGGWGE